MENEEIIAPDSGDMDILNEGIDDDKAPEESGKTPSEDIDNASEEDNNLAPADGEEGKETLEAGEEGKETKEEATETHDDGKNPSFAKINEAYPDFFKKFPEVRTALGRELEYKKLYPTIDDAKESKSRLDFHMELEESIMGGKPGLLLSTLHKTDEKALEAFSTNFLPTLLKGNPPLYEKVALPIVKNVLLTARKEAEKTNSKDLANAVNWVASWFFDNEDGSIPNEEKKETNDEPSEDAKNLQRMLLQKVTDFRDELTETTQTILENTVKSTVDPKKEVPSVLREALVNKILSDLKTELGKDTEHTSLMTRLWAEARKSNYSRQSLNQLKTAYLVGAKKILPVIQKKRVEETLREMGKRPQIPVDNKTRKIGPSDKEKPKFTKGWSKDPKKLDPTKTDADLLGMD